MLVLSAIITCFLPATPMVKKFVVDSVIFNYWRKNMGTSNVVSVYCTRSPKKDEIARYLEVSGMEGRRIISPLFE